MDVLTNVAAALGDVDASKILQEAYVGENDKDEHEYNFSTLICLPKKISGEDPTAGVYYTPENTRPLSIVNTDNRLVANAARLRWESLLKTWVSENQQGFLCGRSLLSNLLSLDTTAMHTALNGGSGAMVLFDFRAAFPSLAQDYLMQVLQQIGLPTNAINLVSSLYDNNKCMIRFQGETYQGFSMTSGVRQGCPLSPLLFALAADVLLEKISVALPSAWVRAYADDTAVILSDFWHQAPKLAEVSKQFAQLSNLHLNHAKCIIIPLNPRGLECPLRPKAQSSDGQFHDGDAATTGDPLKDGENQLRQHIPTWSYMSLAWCGTYFGFVVGPGKQDSSWTKPVDKFIQQSTIWGEQALGLQYTAWTYNVFGMSTLSFVAQLKVPPAWVYEQERVTLHAVAKGPRDWVYPEDLCRHGVAIGPKQCQKKRFSNLVFPIIFDNIFNYGKLGLRYAVSIGTFGSCPRISSSHTRTPVYSLLGLVGH